MVQFSISDRGGNRCGKSKREGTFCTAGSTEGSDWKAGSDRDGDESIFGRVGMCWWRIFRDLARRPWRLLFPERSDCRSSRVQFTPDVLPSDLTGFTIYQKERNVFVYHPGAVVCNLLLADEINRASPKTQSALLEVMEEGQVTVDGKTRKIAPPFLVIATENPSGSAGTQLLPESQLDRFMDLCKDGISDNS